MLAFPSTSKILHFLYPIEDKAHYHITLLEAYHDLIWILLSHKRTLNEYSDGNRSKKKSATQIQTNDQHEGTL